ncbi:MAG: ACP S-malonyltransferase [Actinomycetota bacterium]
MITIVCPGQGSQTPGFLSPWLEVPNFKEEIERLQEILKLDLVRLGTTAEADEIRDTAIAQPLIVAAGIASYLALKASYGSGLPVKAVAGHSVGEITAAFVAGIFDEVSACRFVNRRGQEMAKAAALEETSMAAVVGGTPEEIAPHLEELGLTPANYNGPGQIVAAGDRELIAQLVANPPAGTRVVQLQVAGAFHTDYMHPAKALLNDLADDLEVHDPKISIWTNRDGSRVETGAAFLAMLVDQVSNPVRWDLNMESMVHAGTTGIIELVPGGTLTSIAKRSMPGVESVALKVPNDLEKALELIERHR